MIDPKTKTGAFCVPSGKEQQLLAVAVGERLQIARDQAGLSQLNAAKQIGYSNSTKLSKIETGRPSSQVPMWVLKRAAQVYDVSLDYIFNLGEGFNAEGVRTQELMQELHAHDNASITELLNNQAVGREELAGAIRVLSVEMDMLKIRNPHLSVSLLSLDAAVTLVTSALSRYSSVLTSPAKLNMQAASNLQALTERAAAFV